MFLTTHYYAPQNFQIYQKDQEQKSEASVDFPLTSSG